MARTARHMKSDLHHKLDDALSAGKKAVVVVAMLAVGREGLETALFLWASAQATSGTAVNASPNLAPLVGAALGLGTAVLFGWLIYRGALRLNMRVFFAWTGLFLVVIAAGVLAYGVHDLQEAGILPGLNNLAFDVSATDPPEQLVRHRAQGRLQLLAGHDLAPAVRLDGLPRADDVLLHPHHVGLRARSADGPRRPARRPRLRRLTPASRSSPRRPMSRRSTVVAAALAALVLPLAAACVPNDPGGRPARPAVRAC